MTDTISRRAGAARLALAAALTVSAIGPFVLLLLRSFGRDWFYPDLLPERFSVDSWSTLSGAGSRLGEALASSLVLALATGSLACALGFPVGRTVARLGGWRRHAGAAAAFLPVAAPPLALAIGLHVSLLRLGLAGSLGGVLLAHLVPALGYTSLYFLGIFAVFDSRVEEEARTLGARPVQVLARVTLPLLRRPLIEAFVLGFLVSWAQVPLTLLIGQGVVTSLPVEVLGYVEAGQDRLGAAGALLLMVPPLATMAAAGIAIRRAGAPA